MNRVLPLILLAAGLLPSISFAGGEIYGTVYTDRGETFTGPIRWDRNENFWDDVLDAEKDKEVRRRDRGTDVRVFGIRISASGDTYKVSPEFTIPFGHIRSIETGRKGSARIELKNGEILTVKSGSDLGNSMRGLVVGDHSEGEVDLDWGAVERIEFLQNPASGPGRDVERLYGTVETREGRFTGFVVWDRDESLAGDILDGDDDGRRYKIPFRKIKAIERMGDRGSRVTLEGGREVELTGTNDVNDENRGIDLTIDGIGMVKISWDEFRRVEFHTPPASHPYGDFDGGWRLQGTVTNADGASYTGQVIWDDDEEYSWEALNGEAAGVDFAILFENIASIRRDSRQEATVTTRNGAVFKLSGSNDVDHENKGVIIRTPDGEEVHLDWSDFEEVRFSGR